MAYKEDAIALITESKEIFVEIKKAYEESLHEHEIKPKLLIKIKNFMENLRSALDFTAHHLFDKYGVAVAGNNNVYFPYAWTGLTLDEFRRKNLIQNRIPGLIVNRPDIAAEIESYQYFSRAENYWLPKFMELNNENKHQRLTPQTRKETKELNVKSKDGAVTLKVSPNQSIILPEGVTLKMGNATIRGGQSFSLESPPVIINGTNEIIIWVSFEFTDINEPVLSLLENALNGCFKIVSELTDR
ncbi:hypothetical protein L1276_003264 [Flavobacterium sp. HSC-32F16]|uniref:hypothetical protein n=1 Tax=Flavobacterium sp. HSC-32F16 TaxID=2910964 RepID=UPI0020A33FC5|nr:hypothetical protein [Flavobacterium sp. HSC-32F16]MCP2028096.1 hypothetical protein [Flavobacterium sp. HSC-32F16]